MRRRTLLASLGPALVSVAGCVTAPGPSGAADGERAGEETDMPAPAGTGEALADAAAGEQPSLRDVDLPIDSAAFTYATGRDAIPAITEPAFAPDWSGLDQPGDSPESDRLRLRPADAIIGVARAGEARAYPLRVMARHEIVNDRLDEPLLVSYCPLCGSGVTAVRRVRGEATVFGVSGRLWRNDLVMYDQLTGSYWSQLLATAIRGRATGETLSLVPSTLTTWDAWQRDHPDTRVLLPPPESTTITGGGARYYGADSYTAYEESRLIGVTGREAPDAPIHPKTRVLGVTAGETARAYPEPAIAAAGGVVNDVVGDRPVVVATGPGETLVGYERRLDDEVLDVARADPRHLRADGSRWRLGTGEAVDGPHQGTTLRRATPLPPLFWFAWHDFHPETTLYGEAASDGG